ncbi:MAG: helix-turn-helix domain-containing protein [Sphaerochaeta sp.]|nr:helix-turn-helix domain-containing protein [Sphaerochaeta sp.]
MLGYDCICDAIALFERSMEGSSPGAPPIRSVAELAERTGYSPFHFSRLFSAIAGMPPKAYIQGRLLSRLATEISETDSPITHLAQNYGYVDYETFARAFKSRFHIAPSAVRKDRFVPHGCLQRWEPQVPAQRTTTSISGGDLVGKEAFVLCGLPFFIELGEKSFHKHWASFMHVQDRMNLRDSDDTAFHQFSAWNDDAELHGLSVLCARRVAEHSTQPPIFTLRTVPAAEYVVFRHEGGPKNLALTYQYIYGQWFATHDLKASLCWEFQRYPENGDLIEIHIPIALV